MNGEKDALSSDVVNSHLIAEGIGHPITINEEQRVGFRIDVGTDMLTLNLHLNYKRNYTNYYHLYITIILGASTNYQFSQ